MQCTVLDIIGQSEDSGINNVLYYTVQLNAVIVRGVHQLNR